MEYRHYGESLAVEALKNNVVYASPNLISSLPYAGHVSKIQDSTTFTQPMKDALKQMLALVSLGKVGDEYKNIHVYTPSAKTLDGRDRICYLQQDGDDLLVSEFHGNRGAKYSALYLLLEEQLIGSAFIPINGTHFRIPLKRVPTFVKVLNNVVSEYRQDKYYLHTIRETDTLLIDNMRWYYVKCYWSRVEIGLSPMQETIEQFKTSLKTSTDVAELTALQDTLLTLLNLVNSKLKLQGQLDKL